ncbi:hypothetical protein [Stenotrophomonas sepilia]|uniref:hypothetical protein n=1 Tax=Stenotrophomonas sepilia TaxID=2860290 RepID=UPI002E79E1CC|nr:hypothetical protein [Stenotrophomonas sepilia]
MLVEAENYFALIVEPTCAEYFERPWDFRRGILSLIVTSHMVDYWVMDNYAGSQSRKAMGDAVSHGRLALTGLHPDLQLLADAADAAKHGRLASLQNRTRQISGADQLQSTPGIFNAPFGQGVFAEAMEIYFDSPEGRRVSIRRLLTQTLDFWRGQLGIQSKAQPSAPGQEIPD